MSQQKYIRHSELGFFIWNDMNPVFHKHLAEFLVRHMRGEILSAGFVDIHLEEGAVVCHGRSESLGIESKPGDSAALLTQLTEGVYKSS